VQDSAVKTILRFWQTSRDDREERGRGLSTVNLQPPTPTSSKDNPASQPRGGRYELY